MTSQDRRFRGGVSDVYLEPFDDPAVLIAISFPLFWGVEVSKIKVIWGFRNTPNFELSFGLILSLVFRFLTNGTW